MSRIHLHVVLIETLWNVNYVDTPDGRFYRCCFNRNIVECKLILQGAPTVTDPGFNRNIVECKSDHMVLQKRNWERFNRNIVECKYTPRNQSLKKISCFNRNIVECKWLSGFCNIYLQLCFNRNIVECKFWWLRKSESISPVLIETLWNVNWIIVGFQFFQDFVLIETLWNVNDFQCPHWCPEAEF